MLCRNPPQEELQFHNMRQQKQKTKEGRKKETNKAIPNESAGRRSDNSPTPTPSQKQSASCSFQNQVDGCARQIPPTLLSGWLPPTAHGAAHTQLLPGQHITIIISDLHRRRWRRTRMGRGWPFEQWAGLSMRTGTSWAILQRKSDSACVWVWDEVTDIGSGERERMMGIWKRPASEWVIS